MVAEVTQCATPSSPMPSSSSDNSFIESALEGMIAQEIESESIMHEVKMKQEEVTVALIVKLYLMTCFFMFKEQEIG